jgi:hypothetical protein
MCESFYNNSPGKIPWPTQNLMSKNLTERRIDKFQKVVQEADKELTFTPNISLTS